MLKCYHQIWDFQCFPCVFHMFSISSHPFPGGFLPPPAIFVPWRCPAAARRWCRPHPHGPRRGRRSPARASGAWPARAGGEGISWWKMEKNGGFIWFHHRKMVEIMDFTWFPPWKIDGSTKHHSSFMHFMDFIVQRMDVREHLNGKPLLLPVKI